MRRVQGHPCQDQMGRADYPSAGKPFPDLSIASMYITLIYQITRLQAATVHGILIPFVEQYQLMSARKEYSQRREYVARCADLVNHSETWRALPDTASGAGVRK